MKTFCKKDTLLKRGLRLFLLALLLGFSSAAPGPVAVPIDVRVLSAVSTIRNVLSLEDLYAIQTPTFAHKRLQFDLEFQVNNALSDTRVQYTIFDGHQCKHGDGDIGDGDNDITFTNNYLLSRLRPDFHPTGNGDGFRKMKVSLNIDTDNIRQSPIYQDFKSFGIVKYCVRFSTFSDDVELPQAIEANFLEVPVSLKVFLEDTFQEQSITQISDLDEALKLAEQNSAVEAYICDSEANVIGVDDVQKEQGTTVRVCVVPTQTMLDKGVYLRYIEEFFFYRDDAYQEAIASGTLGSAANDLTVVDCVPGSELCAFETLLSAQFFVNGTGTVQGRGSAFLQFGQDIPVFDELVNRQLLEERTQRRYLDEDDAVEQLSQAASGFSFQILVAPTNRDEDPFFSRRFSSAATSKYKVLQATARVILGVSSLPLVLALIL